jgi:hypothetical protein
MAMKTALGKAMVMVQTEGMAVGNRRTSGG